MMITQIGDILKDTIPDFENLEIILSQHYLHNGYDKKHHMLLIRNCVYCHYGCNMDFDLDTREVIQVLEEKLPITVEFDKIISIEKGVTYKFYIIIKEEEAG